MAKVTELKLIGKQMNIHEPCHVCMYLLLIFTIDIGANLTGILHSGLCCIEVLITILRSYV